MAGATSALGLSFHADIGLVDQCRRELLLGSDPASINASAAATALFHSIADLQTAIKRYIEEHNNDPKPFIWTKDATAILERVARVNQASESLR